MVKSGSDTASSENHAFQGINGDGRNHTSQSADSIAGEYGELITQARTWIEENQTAAMLGGFGFGVFIGVLLRR